MELHGDLAVLTPGRPVTGSHAARPTAARSRQRAADLGREVLLTAAALFGAVCLVLVVLVATLDLGVIVFRTGSMSPTIPTGAAALVRTTPADEVEVGDVVTVPAPVGDLPVTHRVIHIETLDDGTTRLRLRGDANDSEDPFPYDVTEVRRVVASAPGVGYALVRMGEPKALAAVTVGVALLVGWALWPRERREPTPRRRRRAPAGALAVAALAAAALQVAHPAPAAAEVTPPPGGFEQPGAGDGLLALSSSLPAGDRWELSPGTDLAWRVDSAVREPADAAGARGTLWVSLLATGPLVERGGVALVLQLCDSGWAADGLTCPGGAREVPATVAGGTARVDRAEVGAVETGRGQGVVVRVRVPAGLADDYQGLDMTLGLRFDAFGEEFFLSDVLAAADDESGTGATSDVLGVTGADLRPALWAAFALLTGWSAVAWSRARRRARDAVAVADAPEEVAHGAP